jgi:hypothetical protein
MVLVSLVELCHQNGNKYVRPWFLTQMGHAPTTVFDVIHALKTHGLIEKENKELDIPGDSIRITDNGLQTILGMFNTVEKGIEKTEKRIRIRQNAKLELIAAIIANLKEMGAKE